MKKICCWAFLFIFFAGISFSQDSQTQPLSLADAIGQALQNNLDLQLERLNPQIAGEALRKARAIFIPVLKLNLSKSKSTNPSSNIFTGAQIKSSENESVNVDLYQLLPLGGTVDVIVDSVNSSTNSRYDIFNPSINSTLTFNLSQPLLRGFGTFAARFNILLARNEQQKAIFLLKQRITEIVYAVEEAYWNLVYAQRNLEVKQKSLQLAQDLLKQNEIQVKVGVSAPMDILAAKAEVAARDSEVLQAENQAQITEENLKHVLNISQLNAALVPSDQPLFENMATDFQQFLLEALDSRPEMAQIRLDLKNSNIQVKYYRNQMLPDLRLNASYYTAGLSGDYIKWDVDPFLSPDAKIVSVIKGDVWDSLKDVVANLYRNYAIELQLSLPLRNDANKANLVQAQLSARQSLLQLKKMEATIYSEVKQGIQDVVGNVKIVDSTRISRELADQKLNAEQKKFAVGLSTNYLVLQYQRDYITAQIAELRSLMDYRLALARLDRILGRTLAKHQISFSESGEQSF